MKNQSEFASSSQVLVREVLGPVGFLAEHFAGGINEETVVEEEGAELFLHVGIGRTDGPPIADEVLCGHEVGAAMN